MNQGAFPSSITPQVSVMRPARQRVAITTGTTQSILRDQIVGTDADFTLYCVRPSGAIVTFTLNSIAVGWSVTDNGTSPFSVWKVTVPTSVYTTSGVYTITIIYGSGAEYQTETVSFLWGGWIDTIYTNAANSATYASTAATQSATAATQATNAATSAATAATQATTAATQATTAAAQATIAATQATTARKMQTNKVLPDDADAPTELTVYDDDGTTPLGSRTIANCDNTAINPAQILRLGALT